MTTHKNGIIDLPELEVIESPCVGRCCLDEEDICLGCYRSLEEITTWTIVDNATRRKYLEKIEARRQGRMIDSSR